MENTEKSILKRITLDRRQAIGLAGGIAAAAVFSTLTNAFAGAGGASGAGPGGGGGSYQGLFFIDWHDSKDGVEQGHTVDSNMKFWAKRITQAFNDTWTSPNYTHWRGFAFRDQDLNSPRYDGSTYGDYYYGIFKNAMDKALARNATGGTYESDHVRVVGVSFIGLWAPNPNPDLSNTLIANWVGGYPDWIIHDRPTNSSSHKTWQSYMEATDMLVRPQLDKPDAGVGRLESADGWSESLITMMMDTYKKDGDLGYQGSGYVVAVWAVSDADFGIDVKVSKKSGAPLLANDMAGAQYTIYKDAACTQIAKLNDGSNAVLTVGSGNVTTTVTIARSEGFAHTGGSFKLYVKETKAPANGMFELDPVVHEITMESNETVTVESTVTTVNSVDEVKPAQIAVRKRTANKSYTSGNANYNLAAVFEVRKGSATGTVVATITTDATSGNSDWVEVEAAADGTKYVIIEKTPAKGHIKSGPWEMTLKPGDKKYVNE